MKKNGFTLIEIILVVAILGILSTMAVASLSGRGEKDAKAFVRERVPLILGNALHKSFEEGRQMTIQIELPDRIKVLNGSAVMEQVNLPKNLNYSLVTDSEIDVGTSASITINQEGGFALSQAQNIKILNKQGQFVLRIRMRNVGQVSPGVGLDVGIIEVYTNEFNGTPNSRI